MLHSSAEYRQQRALLCIYMSRLHALPSFLVHLFVFFCILLTKARGGRLRGSWDANYPCPPPGAFGQQLVAKGVALRRPWAPKAPDAT